MSALYKSLLKAQSNMGAVKKDEKNPFFKSSYASLNAVREAVMPALNEQGIVLTQPTVMLEGKQFVETRLTHADSGEFTTAVTEVIVKSANNAQEAGSGMSYARRYGLMALLCLAAEDDDANLASGKTQSKQQVITPAYKETEKAKEETLPRVDVAKVSAVIPVSTTGAVDKSKMKFSRAKVMTSTGDDI